MDYSGANRPLTLLAVCATILMTWALLSDNSTVEQYDTGRDLNALVINRTYTQRNDSFEASVQYFGGVALYGLPGFVLALVAIISLFAFCGCYFGCKKCGRIASQERFSRKQRLPYRIILGIFVLFTIGGVIVGMYGNRSTTTDIRSITSTAREAIIEVSFKLDNISTLVAPLDPSFPAYLDPIKGQVVEINATVVDADKQIGSLDIFRNLVVHFGFLTALVTAAVGLTAAITQQSKLALALGMMGLITVFFMGSGFGLHVPISFVMDDFCQKVDDYLTANDTSTDLGILLSCVNGGTFGDAFDSLKVVIQQEFIDLNDTATRETGFSFDPTLNATNNTLPAIAEAAVVKLNNLKAIIAPYLSQASQDVQDQVNQQIQRVETIIDVIQQLLRIADCQFVASFAERIVTEVCVDVIEATILIYIGQVVIAFIMIPYAILGFVAAYKFKRPYPDRETPKSVRQPIFENPFIFNMIAVAMVGLTHAVVALTDVNINQWVPIAGLAVFIAVQVFGIVGAAVRNKVIVIIYALLESIVFLLLLGVLIIFSVYLYGCDPNAPLYGPDLCELFTDRTTTINNLILVCFVVVIGIFAIIYSWRLFLHLHRKKTYTHIVRQSTRSHLNVNRMNISASNGAPLPGRVAKPSQGLSDHDMLNMRPVPTAYKGQLNMNAPEIEMFHMPVGDQVQPMDYDSSSDQSRSRSQSQSQEQSMSRSQSRSPVQDNSQEASEDSSAESSSQSQSQSQSQSPSESPASETRVDVGAQVDLRNPMPDNEASNEEESEYESDNESPSASHSKSASEELEESNSAEGSASESSSADEDEWSHSEV